MAFFNPEKFTTESVEKLKTELSDKAIIAASGGVDSTVAAVLAAKAVKDSLLAIYVDTGYMRVGESEYVSSMLSELGVQHKVVDASEQFYAGLKGVIDPEEKRKIIGELFIRVFEKEAEEYGGKFLVQGTIAPDWIESGGGLRDTIKSHHNVGGLPEDMDMVLCEPIRELYKDEVRQIAKILGVPEKLFMRHPFPGPGLSVRIMGEITETKLQISKIASKIVEEELMESGFYTKVWQAYAAVGDDKAVGVVGDERKYGNIVMIRVVDSIDAMTADWTRLPHGVLEKMSNRITNEIEDVTWVTYTISSKPPATIEPQ